MSWNREDDARDRPAGALGQPFRIGWPEGGTLACLYEGTALLTGLSYPLWRLKQIEERCQMPGTTDLSDAVSCAGTWLYRGREEGRQRELEAGYALLRHLLIEPFSLIH